MYTVKISAETAESMFKDILIQDYHGLCAEVDKLLHRDGLAAYEEEDLRNDLRWIEAMKTLMEYYLTVQEREELLGEAATGE